MASLAGRQSLRLVGGLLCLLAVAATGAGRAFAGNVDTEWSVVGGASTDGSQSAAGVLKVFGSPERNLRVYFEGVSGERTGRSDSFSSAYPYGRILLPVETYAESDADLGHYQASVRAGRYRPPFGIYSESDQGYMGFLRAPLVRYQTNWALSTDWIESGADLSFGTPELQVEGSFSTPGEGIYRRRSGLDDLVRLQGYHGDLIVGLSHITTRPASEYGWAHGMSRFSGFDFRWMRGGTQFRGEWISGQPFDGGHTTGWYVDAIVHWSSLERVTWIARVEGLRYRSPVSPEDLRRVTVGGRIALHSGLWLEINGIRQTDAGSNSSQALDVGLSYSVRSHG